MLLVVFCLRKRCDDRSALWFVRRQHPCAAHTVDRDREVWSWLCVRMDVQVPVPWLGSNCVLRVAG